MLSEKKFDEIRPYRDDEVAEVMRRLVVDPIFDQVLLTLYQTPERVKEIKSALLQTDNVDDFQVRFMLPYLDKIIQDSTEGISIGGLENIDPQRHHSGCGFNECGNQTGRFEHHRNCHWK